MQIAKNSRKHPNFGKSYLGNHSELKGMWTHLESWKEDRQGYNICENQENGNLF